MRTVSRASARPASLASFAFLALLSLLSLLASGALLVPAPVAAQQSTIVSQAAALDPSIQTAAMGGASVAVFWLDEPNEWGNPATLGSVHGVRYAHGETSLTPLSVNGLCSRKYHLFGSRIHLIRARHGTRIFLGGVFFVMRVAKRASGGTEK